MTANPTALQLYTVREQMAADRAGVLAQVAALGYGAVEPFNILSDPDGLRADLDAAGLFACSVHAAPTGAEAEAVVRAARTLGTDTVIIPYLPPPRFADADSVQATARELNEVAAGLAGQGLRMGYHNHDFELASLVGGVPALEVLADQLDDAVLLEVDTYWAAVGGQDVVALLGRLGDRVRYLHVKDGPVVNRDDFMTAVGAGRMPVAEILAASPSARWHVVELDRCATDMMIAVGDSLTWLVGQGLAQPGRARERRLMTAAAGPVGVAVIGCGTISREYLRNLTSFPDLRVLFCADIDLERAKEQAARYGVPEAGTVAEALREPGVELVVNLTIPVAHAEITSAALAAGKSVWTEKPLALDTATGQRLLAEADRAGLRLGCAPDTVLGAGLQTARRLMAAGAIGVPQTALALMQNPGPELWHPDPEFLFQRGAGPLFDIGPYYLTVLATIFGPAEQVAAVGHSSRDTRVIAVGPRAGTEFRVEVPTHVSTLIEYAQGPVATLVLSFESPLPRPGLVEITGTEATLALPDPNRFDGEIRLRATGADEWQVLPTSGATDGRGLGVLDMARALRGGGQPRASGDLGLHVLETIEAIERSVADRSFEPVRSVFSPPEALDPSWDPKTRTPASA